MSFCPFQYMCHPGSRSNRTPRRKLAPRDTVLFSESSDTLACPGPYPESPQAPSIMVRSIKLKSVTIGWFRGMQISVTQPAFTGGVGASAICCVTSAALAH